MGECAAARRRLIQIIERRIVARLVSELLHHQALDRQLNRLDIFPYVFFSDVDLLVLGPHQILFFFCSLVEPLLALSVEPSALLDLELSGVLGIWHYIEAFTVLLARLPLAVVGSAVRPEVYADSALPVVNVLPDEHSAVAPPVRALPMHHVVVPVAEVEAIIVPHEETLSIEHIVAPFANVPVAIRPPVLSLAFLRGIQVKALILTTIVPLLFTESVLFVLVPVAHILASVGVPVDSKALRHVVNELALVEVATCMVELSSAIIEVVLPEPLVDGAVGPLHDAVALLDVLAVFQHLPRVDSTIVRLVIDAHIVHVV